MRPLPITDLEQLEASAALARMRTWAGTSLPGASSSVEPCIDQRVAMGFECDVSGVLRTPYGYTVFAPLLPLYQGQWRLIALSAPKCRGDGSQFCCVRNGCHPVCNCRIA